MSSYKFARRLFLLSLLAVAGCGYGPAYGPGGSADVLRNQVTVDPPSNRNQFDLVTQLEQRLGRPDTPRYQLSYVVSTRQDGVALTLGNDVFRYNIIGRANFTLKDALSGDVLTKSSVDTFTSYSIGFVDASANPPSTSATIASVAAEQDAYRRLMTALADQIVNRLATTSGSWNQ